MDVGTKMSAVGRLMMKLTFQSAWFSYEYFFYLSGTCPFIHTIKPYSYCLGSCLSTLSDSCLPPLSFLYNFNQFLKTIFQFCGHFPLHLPLWPCSWQGSFAFKALKTPPDTSQLFPIFLPIAPVQNCVLLLKRPFIPVDSKCAFGAVQIHSQICFPGPYKDA